MKIIIKTNLVSGGNPVVAVAAGVGVFTTAAAIIQSFDTITNAGDRLGEAVYTSTHKDDNLGKMTYEKDDYAPQYLAYKHPNNNSNVHGHFGNF